MTTSDKFFEEFNRFTEGESFDSIDSLNERLSTFSNNYTPVLLLTDRFTKAFPSAVRDCPHYAFESPGETLKSALSLRFLERFAEPFGLLDLQWQPVNKFVTKPVAYRTTALYRELLRWDR